MLNELFPRFLCQIERILCAFNVFVRLTWLRNYDLILSRWIDLNSAFQSALLFYLLSNILRPGRRCCEDLYKLNEWADERSGRRAYDGGAADAVGAVSEFFSPSSWMVTPRLTFFNDPI